jgi:formamidopyrimidine-DNA glycosylase
VRKFRQALRGRRFARPQRHDHLVFAIDGGELRYNDMRKLHGVWLLAGEEKLNRRLAALGPDALKLTRTQFEAALARRGRLKPVLMDQSVVAGLGNLLVDEICWRARLSPLRCGAALARRKLAGRTTVWCPRCQR